MATWNVLIVELDGQHVTPGFLWTNYECKSKIVALNEFTHRCLIDADALGSERTCIRQSINQSNKLFCTAR